MTRAAARSDRLKARRVFEDIAALVPPTVSHGPHPLADGERANDADLPTSRALPADRP